MAIYVAYLIILSLLAGIIVDISSAIVTGLFFAVGLLLVYFCNEKEKESLTKIYSFSFLSCLTYILMCYVYMVSHGYNHLLINDTQGYIDDTKSVIAGDVSLFYAIDGLWKDYDFLLRNSTGYMTYLTIFGYLAKVFNSDLYYTLQISTTSICSFGAVIIYKLLSYYIDDKNDVFKFAIIIVVLPMYWQYSTLILRDGLVALCFYYVIWLLHKSPGIITILKFLAIVIFNTTLRTETGYASVMFFPMYLLMDKDKSIKVKMIGIVLVSLMAVAGYYIYMNFESLFKVFQDNQEAYFSDSGEGSTIGFFSRIPIVGGVISLIYGLSQPIPCWARLSNYYMPMLIRPCCYNIMGFPSIFYVAFNVYIICYLINYWFYYSYSQIKARKLKIIMIPAAVYMLLQSGIVEPRRMMGVFVVFYVFWAITYRQVSPTYNKLTYSLFVKIFLVLQIIGIIRYL